MLAEDCSVYALSSITLYWYHFLSTSYFLLPTFDAFGVRGCGSHIRKQGFVHDSPCSLFYISPVKF
jgi:hypothetical protein